MANRINPHDATASATGYLYQCRIALLKSLDAILLNPNQKISIERFDDISFGRQGSSLELIQIKQHLRKADKLMSLAFLNG